jgi:hypothetical protein
MWQGGYGVGGGGSNCFPSIKKCMWSTTLTSPHDPTPPLFPPQNEIFRLKSQVSEQATRLTALEGVEADNASLRDKVAGLRANLLTTQRALEELPKAKARASQLEEENAALLATQQAQVRCLSTCVCVCFSLSLSNNTHAHT